MLFIEKAMLMFWAEVSERPEIVIPWLIVLAFLLLTLVTQVRSARVAVRRHKALISSLEKSYYYQQEVYAHIGDKSSDLKGLLISRDEDFERLLKSFAEKLSGLDVDALSQMTGDNDKQVNALQNMEELLVTHRELLAKQGVFVYDEISALTAKIEQLNATANALKTETNNTDLRKQLESVKNELSVEITAKLGSALQDATQSVAQSATQNQDGQKAVLEMLTQAMNHLSSEVDAKLTLLNSKLEKNIEVKWGDAVASINTLRAQIADINAASDEIKRVSANVMSLTNILQTRAESSNDGRRHLADVLPQVLLPENFQMDYELPNGHHADAFVHFPDPKDSVAIDAGIPLKSFDDFIASFSDSSEPEKRDGLRRRFREDVVRHIEQVGDYLIAPPNTGERALLFIPSEAAFAEIQAHQADAVQLAIGKRVWLVSPSTLVAVLNTARMAIRDQQAREQLIRLQESLGGIVEEARLFENRLAEIGDHVNSAWRSVQRAESASGKLIGSIHGASSAAGISPTSQRNLHAPMPSDESRSS